MVKKIALNKNHSKSKYLIPEIETSTKNNICECFSPFSDNEQIMMGKSRLANRGTHIMVDDAVAHICFILICFQFRGWLSLPSSD